MAMLFFLAAPADCQDLANNFQFNSNFLAYSLLMEKRLSVTYENQGLLFGQTLFMSSKSILSLWSYLILKVKNCRFECSLWFDVLAGLILVNSLMDLSTLDFYIWFDFVKNIVVLILFKLNCTVIFQILFSSQQIVLIFLLGPYSNIVILKLSQYLCLHIIMLRL